MSADRLHYVVYDGYISTRFKLKLVRCRGIWINNAFGHVIVYAQRIWREVVTFVSVQLCDCSCMHSVTKFCARANEETLCSRCFNTSMNS